MAVLTLRTDFCKGCGLCVEACPKGVLGISKTTLNKKGYAPVEVVDQEACVGCASCAVMCPDCIITVEK